MGKHKNLPLLFIVLILSLVVLGSTYSLAAGPTGNPPSSNVTPTFSGLEVTGPISNPETTGGFALLPFGAIELDDVVYTDSIMYFDAPIGGTAMNVQGTIIGIDPDGYYSIMGDVKISGKLKADQFGMIYQNSATASVPNNQYNNQTVYCDSGDWALSCYGGFDPDLSLGFNLGVSGIEPSSYGSYQGCKVQTWNQSGTSRTMYAHVTCVATEENWGG